MKMVCRFSPNTVCSKPTPTYRHARTHRSKGNDGSLRYVQRGITRRDRKPTPAQPPQWSLTEDMGHRSLRHGRTVSGKGYAVYRKALRRVPTYTYSQHRETRSNSYGHEATLAHELWLTIQKFITYLTNVNIVVQSRIPDARKAPAGRRITGGSQSRIVCAEAKRRPSELNLAGRHIIRFEDDR